MERLTLRGRELSSDFKGCEAQVALGVEADLCHFLHVWTLEGLSTPLKTISSCGLRILIPRPKKDQGLETNSRVGSALL